MIKCLVGFVKNSIYFLGMLFLLSILVFYMARLSPGDPVKAYYGDGAERMNDVEKEAARERMGLDKPIYIQYQTWLQDAVSGDFGISFKYKQSVLTVLGEMYQNTLILGMVSYFLTFSLALLLGIFCVLHENEWVDHVICKIGVVSNCIPSFWLSLVLILIFSVNLKILPSSGAYGLGKESDLVSRIIHLILPVTVMVLGHLWYYTYLIRNKLLEEVRKEYVLMAKAKGLGALKIVWRHCVPNILPALLSLMAISIPHMIAGTYIVEQVFSYPGLGSLCFESAKYHDYNLLMVLCLITGALVLLSNRLAQIIGERMDPRMKITAGKSLGGGEFR